MLVAALYLTLAVAGLFWTPDPGCPPRDREAQMQVDQVAGLVEQYYVVTGNWPACLHELTTSERTSALLLEIPDDPWGSELRYAVGGSRGFFLCSDGPNRRTGDDDDICAGGPLHRESPAFGQHGARRTHPAMDTHRPHRLHPPP